MIYLCTTSVVHSVTLSYPPDTLIALSVGDKVPDMTINNMINYPKTSVRISDFKGKVLILDFWATWCSSCLHHFPIADSIQHQFSDQLQILLVDTKSTNDTEAKILRSLRSFDQPGHKFDLPSVIADTKLDQLFKLQVLPHYVWIDQAGNVRATTLAEELTRENIAQFISSGKIPKYQKKDFDHNRPLYTAEELPLDRLQHFSILIKGKTDGNGGGGMRKINDTTRGQILHDRSLLMMYSTVFAHKYPGNFDCRYILETKNPSQLAYNLSPKNLSRQEWERNNFYSYEIIVPYPEMGHLYDDILEDLNRNTPYTASFEKGKNGAGSCPAVKTGNGSDQKNPPGPMAWKTRRIPNYITAGCQILSGL